MWDERIWGSNVRQASTQQCPRPSDPPSPTPAPVTVRAASSTWMGKLAGAVQLGATCLGLRGALMLQWGVGIHGWGGRGL